VCREDVHVILSEEISVNGGRGDIIVLLFGSDFGYLSILLEILIVHNALISTHYVSNSLAKSISRSFLASLG
jgi:hypothetical protein